MFTNLRVDSTELQVIQSKHLLLVNIGTKLLNAAFGFLLLASHFEVQFNIVDYSLEVVARFL